MAHIIRIWLLGCIMSGPVSGQVFVDRPVLLNGNNDPDRQVTGLSLSALPQAVLTAGVAQAGSFRTASPVAGPIWNVDLASLSTAPIAGTHVVVVSPTPTAGSVHLVVNGSSPFELLMGPGEPLNGMSVPAGTALSIVFDGTSFHVLNGGAYARKPCPSGLVAVNEAFCIETTDHPPVDFFEAALACGSNGTRLCGWGEFIVACQKGGELGLSNTTNSWEWTGDASNENGSARVVGIGSCLSAGNSLVTGSIPREFRCCYSR